MRFNVLLIYYLDPFEIDTDDAKPINICPGAHSPKDFEKVKESIDENLKTGVISELESPWSFPLAQKPNGGTRVCVDYRALNHVTVNDAHLLPRIDESLLCFFGMKYFTSIHLRSGYWQIIFAYLARAKTAFSYRQGHYQWNVLPFGLSNAPGAFQRQMNKVLRRYIDKFCIVYLDDILIFSETLEEHEQHVRTILHGFLNLESHYRKYIPRFSDIVLQLMDLTKGFPKKAPQFREEEGKKSLFRISNKLSPPNPCYDTPTSANFSLLVRIRHSSLSGLFSNSISTTKMVEDASILHPVAYESKKLTEAESRYSAQEREMVAAKYALDQWRHIVEGSNILIGTDHKSLETFRSKKHMNPRLIRLMQDIEHYNPVFTYRCGLLQTVPDALSRI